MFEQETWSILWYSHATLEIISNTIQMSTSHLNYAESRILLCKLHVASNARSGSYCPCWCWNLKNAILRPVRLAYKPYFFSQRIIFFFNNKSVNSIFSHGLWAERTGHWSVACLWRVVGARLLGGQRHAPFFTWNLQHCLNFPLGTLDLQLFMVICCVCF